ncbi:MAG TPA: hypothetical protein VMR46_00550 [Candidatus Paceibacterota bacterium]|nr:hypothetical protein [Candidatus Paceibacterota bacterium]
MTAGDETEIQRTRLILGLLKQHLNEESRVAFLSLDTLRKVKDAPLGSTTAIEKTLEWIVDASNGEITFDVVETPTMWQREVDTAHPDPEPPVFGPLVKSGFRVWVSNPKKIDEYFNAILKEKNLSVKKPRSKKKPFFSEIVIGKLHACADGLIRFGGNVVDMRPQLATLCWLFMEHEGALVTIDDIKERIIEASKRAGTSNTTIAKYVSELHRPLQDVYGGEVIFNEKDIGWRFEPERTA